MKLAFASKHQCRHFLNLKQTNKQKNSLNNQLKGQHISYRQNDIEENVFNLCLFLAAVECR